MGRFVELDGGLKLELLGRRGRFLGLGVVRAGRAVLRSGRRPMFVDIRTPDGVRLGDYRLAGEKPIGRGVRLAFRMSAQAGGPMEWQLHECRRMLNTSDWSQAPALVPDAKLELDLRPARRRIGRTVFEGFSYQYRYTCRQHPVYMLLDRGTWEPGGRAVGNEVWMRSCHAPSVYAVRSATDHYSTEWYHPGCLNPNIFQFLPLQTELQGFTFTCSAAGVLVTWPTRVAHVRTLIEKPRGCDEIVHMHEHCADLGPRLETSPVEVLWSSGARSRTEIENVWSDVFEHVSEALNAEVGMRRERVTTYGQIEEWGDADLDRYRREGLPCLLNAGARTIYLANHFENNMNTYGVSNMCCTVDYKVAETVGEDRLKAFCDDARRAGARVEMWGNTSVSTLSLILDRRNGRPKRVDFVPREGGIMEALGRARQPWVRTTFGSIEADHYTPLFAVMNLRDPAVREYWMKAWRYAHDRIGLGGIFLDSSFNLSSDKFHYGYNPDLGRRTGMTPDQTAELCFERPASEPRSEVLSQYRAHLDLMREMQEAGYVYCNEDLGVFGVHRHGPGLERRLGCLFMWCDCIANFDAAAAREAGLDPDRVFFEGLAHRMMWSLCWHPPSRTLTFRYDGPRGEGDRPRAWHLELLKAYSRVEGAMRGRDILPDGQGVAYRAGGGLVLWALADFDLPLGRAMTVCDVLSGAQERAAVIRAQALRVYEAR